MKSRTIAALLVLAAVTALAATAGFAAVTAAPDPAQMALLAGDIPNSKVKGTRLKPEAGYVAAYTREFELSKPYGSSQLLYIDSEVSLRLPRRRRSQTLRASGSFSVRRRAASCSRTASVRSSART